MPTLSGNQAEKLWRALRGAYDLKGLRRLLYFKCDGRQLEQLVSPGSLADQVFEIIEVAEREGWVLTLINAACLDRPGNAKVQAMATELGLRDGPASLRGNGVEVTSLERIIRDAAPLLDVSTWLARFGELEAQVCRVEVPAGTWSTAGTGFLVAPGLVLTAYHVVQVLHEGKGDPRNTRLRFDYKLAADGAVVNQGVEFRLADDWLAAWRPPGDADLLPPALLPPAGLAEPGLPLPAADELDFAVLRVRDSPGAQGRGWARAAYVGSGGLDAKQVLFILQHPRAGPLKLAFGQSDGLNANQTRLRYQVSTEHGSSGSPCLNARLELVGLHHAGDPSWIPRYNAAVPIEAILRYLAGTPVAAELFPA